VPGDPRMRASDADRDRVAALLREHHADGRLTTDEVRERLDRALEAKTIGDLDALMTDLPHLDLSPQAQSLRAGGSARAPAGPRQPGGGVARQDAALRVAALAVIVAGYCILGLVFGIWWFPWYLVVLIAVFVLRTRRPL
jgi:Domain of unknown function (DUF1707)